MNITFESHFRFEMVTIFPGEYHATRKSRIISTILGSCIAVALYESVNRIAGMNHFIMPYAIDKDLFYLSESGRYGMYAMELLINKMIKLGGSKKNLYSKVFGGGNVLQSDQNYYSRIPESNIQFAFEYLEAERIPVVSSDVGGTNGRKVYFFTNNAKILLKRIAKSQTEVLESRKSAYMKRIRKDRLSPDKEVKLF